MIGASLKSLTVIKLVLAKGCVKVNNRGRRSHPNMSAILEKIWTLNVLTEWKKKSWFMNMIIKWLMTGNITNTITRISESVSKTNISSCWQTPPLLKIGIAHTSWGFSRIAEHLQVRQYSPCSNPTCKRSSHLKRVATLVTSHFTLGVCWILKTATSMCKHWPSTRCWNVAMF